MGSASIATLSAALLLGLAPGVSVCAVPRLALGTLSDAEAQVRLDAALRALNDFNDARALELFTRLLEREPPVQIAAEVHVYLGIIYFNRLETTQARREFERAVEVDPAVEPPLTISPKARLAFAEARRRVTAEFAKPAPAPAPTPVAVAPSEDRSPNASASVVEGSPPSQSPPPMAASGPAPHAAANPPASTDATAAQQSSSHVLTWTLGSAGVILGAIAVVGLVQVLNYNSVVSNANQHPKTVSSSTVAPSLANAQSWQPWSIGLGIGAAALVVTAVIVW